MLSYLIVCVWDFLHFFFLHFLNLKAGWLLRTEWCIYQHFLDDQLSLSFSKCVCERESVCVCVCSHSHGWSWERKKHAMNIYMKTKSPTSDQLEQICFQIVSKFQCSLFLRITTLLSWLKSTLLLKNKCFDTHI